MSKLPLSFVTVSTEALVAMFVAWTFAPLRTAPEGSVARPMRVARDSCAEATPTDAAKITLVTHQIDRDLINFTSAIHYQIFNVRAETAQPGNEYKCQYKGV
jgi:hypothetical protein